MASQSEEVEVILGSTPEGKATAVLTDRKGGRAWSGEGASHGEAATQATRKFLSDRRAKEYVSSDF